MKLTPPKNPNYAATVVSVKAITDLDNCDNVVGTPLLGYQAIVGKDTQVCDIGIVFTAETQLSQEFASLNNLYRHGERNKDKDKAGYLEDHTRVKAIKFRGHRSDALFLSLSALEYTGADLSNLKPGDTFDYLNGHEICRKYEVKTKIPGQKTPQVAKSRVEDKFFPKHFDTENFFRNLGSIDPGTQAVVTQKIHGTSLRVGNIPVARRLSWLERVAKRLGVKVTETEYSMVYGSRNQTKDANDPSQAHFYSSDIWTEKGRAFDGIPEGYLVFAEIVGWTPDGAPIQKGFTYDLPARTSEVYVYRVAQVNPQGLVVDLSWEQVKGFCKTYGFKVVPELAVTGIYESTAGYITEEFLDKDLFRSYPQALRLSKESPCDEGVCIRVDGMTPKVFKAKSPKFLQHETKMLDKEVLDIEVDA